jgi:hypothetical protein
MRWPDDYDKAGNYALRLRAHESLTNDREVDGIITDEDGRSIFAVGAIQ